MQRPVTIPGYWSSFVDLLGDACTSSVIGKGAPQVHQPASSEQGSLQSKGRTHSWSIFCIYFAWEAWPLSACLPSAKSVNDEEQMREGPWS